MLGQARTLGTSFESSTLMECAWDLYSTVLISTGGKFLSHRHTGHHVQGLRIYNAWMGWDGGMVKCISFHTRSTPA